MLVGKPVGLLGAEVVEPGVGFEAEEDLVVGLAAGVELDTVAKVWVVFVAGEEPNTVVEELVVFVVAVEPGIVVEELAASTATIHKDFDVVVVDHKDFVANTAEQREVRVENLIHEQLSDLHLGTFVTRLGCTFHLEEFLLTVYQNR